MLYKIIQSTDPHKVVECVNTDTFAQLVKGIKEVLTCFNQGHVRPCPKAYANQTSIYTLFDKEGLSSTRRHPDSKKLISGIEILNLLAGGRV
jgi:hypothetical protein